MDNIKVSDGEIPLTNADIKAAENKYGINFPEDYRTFLLKFNGGHPEPCVFFYRFNEEREPASIAYFLAIYEGESENFFDYYETYLGRIPPETMPVARDPGGNLILLGISGESSGKVYYWLQDYEPEEQPDWSNVGFVADSFSEFIESLHAPDA